MRRGLVCVALILYLAAPRAAAADDRAVIGGLGGVAFGAQGGGHVAGSLGANLTKNLRVTAELGRLTAIQPSSIMNDIRGRASAFFAALGDTAAAVGRLDATTILAMVRLTGHGRRVAPFVEGGVGVAHVAGALSIAIEDPSTGAKGSSTQITDPTFNQMLGTRPMAAGGAGVSVAVQPHVTVDIGYRFGRVLSATPISTGRAYMQVQFGF